MVDAVVSFVVERLGDYLIQEANFLRGVRDEVESLKKDLQWMNCFVKDAEAKQAGNDLIRQWVSDIRDIAYDAEDVLDKYMLSVHDAKQETSKRENSFIDGEEGTSNRRQGFFASIKKCSCIFSGDSNHKGSSLYSKGKEKVTLYNIGKEIEALKKRLSDVSRRSESFGLQNIINDTRESEKHDLSRLKQIRRATSFAVEENSVGFEDDTEVLLAKLFDEEQQRRLLISIYGMGGLGKTTLARNLYHNNDVKDRFDCCAWVSVSQDYNLKDLLLRIVKSFDMIHETEDLEKKTVDDLERSICKSLMGYSYLIVLDDIWDKDDWVSLKRAFPENKNGSRVIITTRIKGVAERSDDRTYVHELRFLRQDESWQLFREKAFRRFNVEQGLEELGRDMVEKCRGLPLAIVVLGGLLATKKPQEWRLVRDHLWRHLRSDSIEISHLLDLSFNDMSNQLKLCFLYLGLFPEDFEINAEKLIRLLVAEDFVPQREDRIAEEIAKDYLDELVNRSLIQVEKICWGRVATCRVHDLLRDLAIEKAKEINFIHIWDEMKSSRRSSSVVSSCRRQAIYSSTPGLLWHHHGISLSRSLLLFNQTLSDAPYVERFGGEYGTLFPRFPFLRVFEVQHKPLMDTRIQKFEMLSKRIGKLIHLKYLGFRGSEVTILPSSIVNLQKLQTLDLSSGTLGPVKLPEEINMMQELRHLIGDFIGTLPIENLINLQTLKYVQAESWNKVNSAKLVSLRELHIEEETGWSNNRGSFRELYNEEESEEESERGNIEDYFSFESISKLKSLQFLSVELSDSSFFASVQSLSCCQCLQDLRLRGRMKKLPEDMHLFLKNLECLLLSVSYLEKDPMPALEMLPNLTILDLHIRVHNIEKLSCSGKAFPRLEILQLDTCGVDEWQVEEGALPRLRGLKVPDIPTQKIPERFRSLPHPSEWECKVSRYDF